MTACWCLLRCILTSLSNHDCFSNADYFVLGLSVDPARVLNMPPVIYVPRKLPGIIRCPVDANPPVTSVRWEKDGYPLRVEKVRRLWCTLWVYTWSLFRLFKGVSREHCFFLCALFLTVPWLEPNARWKHSGGRGHWRLPWHLHLCALQCSRYHGTIPSGHSGAKGWSLSIDIIIVLLWKFVMLISITLQHLPPTLRLLFPLWNIIYLCFLSSHLFY